MLYLGFLKFLKRNKSKEPNFGPENIDDLDVPPPPPDLAGSIPGDNNEFPELPELPEMPGNGKDEFPELEESLPELEPIKQKPVSEFPKMEEFPELGPDAGIPKVEEYRKPMLSTQPKPLFAQRPVEQKPRSDFPNAPGMISQKPEPEITPYQKFEKTAMSQQRDVLRHKETKGPVYIRVEKFREILGGMSTIRNNVKIAEQSITRLNEIDENRDKVFERWHDTMMDMQKKLIFVDKELFKK